MQGGIPDPTGQSFLFSLVNASGRPFRLSFIGCGRDPNTSAIDLSLCGCIGFGYQKRVKGRWEKWLNFELFRDGAPANQPNGNYSNHSDKTSAYQLDEESKKTLPKDFKVNQSELGGSPAFGATEIEVYQ